MRRFASVVSASWLLAAGCTDTRSGPGGADQLPPRVDSVPVEVVVDFSTTLAERPPLGFGVHASVYDNALHEASTPDALRESGIALLRYPGGGYADNYHFSVHRLSFFHSGSRLTRGYLASSSEFPSFMQVVEAFGGAAMVTVNYGSNLASVPDDPPATSSGASPPPLADPEGSGPATPEEAAAWVAYANGEPDDDRSLGVDAFGVDWKSVGYWASLRAAEKLGDDDPLDFLRAAHPEPYGVVYFEIGNEVFGNGYYGRNFENDLHVPYANEPPEQRSRHPKLSGITYGGGVADYAKAMKAVDPSAKVGAVLTASPLDDGWAPDWNADVLSQCGSVIDFGIVHYYPGQDPRSMLAGPRNDIPSIADSLWAAFAAQGGEDPARIELAVTEVGSPPGLDWSNYPAKDRQSLGLFAMDAALSFFEHGASNVDWLELHNGTFLSEGSSAARGPAYQGLSLAAKLAEPGDALVSVESSYAPLVVHAARRADGRLGLLLANTLAPDTYRAVVTIDVTGADLPSDAERFDYVPGESTPGIVTGPEPFDAAEGPLTVELEPYQATLLLFGTPL